MTLKIFEKLMVNYVGFFFPPLVFFIKRVYFKFISILYYTAVN